MQVVFYRNISERNDIHKALHELVTLNNVQFTENVNILSPKLSINMNANVLNANYLYIDVLDRFYFINDIEIVNNNLLNINCDVDVLYTYKDSIIQLNVIAERSSNKFNDYLNDNSVIIQTDIQTQIKKFKHKPFTPSLLGNSSRSYILQTARGGN